MRGTPLWRAPLFFFSFLDGTGHKFDKPWWVQSPDER